MASNSRIASFRNIMKGTVIFGGTQMLTMLVNLVRGKLVAVLLGAYGIGINSLLQSAIQPVQQFFSFGLPTSGVTSISNSSTLEDKSQLYTTVTAFRRIMLVLAAMSIVFMVVSAKWLNMFTFNVEDSFTKWFMALGLAVFFMILTACNNTILQGCRCLKRLAMCNIAGPVIGLFIGIPLYYFMGVRGIAPAIILMSFTTWAYTQWHVQKLHFEHVEQSWAETFSIGKKMIYLGGIIMIAGLLGNITIYLINTFIRSYGNIYDVGYYQSATTVTTQCTALVFTALATDYFPHLASLKDNFQKTLQLVNQEGEIVLLLCAPLTILLIIFAPLIVRVLLTEDFDVIVPVIQMMAITFMMRAVFFPLDYIYIANGDKTFFFWIEGIFLNLKMLIIMISGYYLYGLEGLGYAIIINGFIDIIASIMLIKWRYGITYNKKYYAVLLPCFIINICALAAALLLDGMISWGVMIALGVVQITFSLIEINKRVDLFKILRKVVRK